MKKFNFRLQPLLKLRRREEDQKKRVVGAFMSQIHEQQQHALEMSEAIKKEGEYLKQQHRQGRVDLEWVAQYYRFVSHTQNAIAQRVTNVMQIQKKLTVARQELAQAAQKTKILEKLKEKQQKRYEKHLQKIQQRELDEVGANIFLRSTNAEIN